MKRNADDVQMLSVTQNLTRNRQCWIQPLIWDSPLVRFSFFWKTFISSLFPVCLC